MPGRTIPLALALIAGLAAAADLRAQTAAAETAPLARYVAKDNLVLYVEWTGLDAQADAWKKTAAYRMLNETPLGKMLEEVAAQFIDKLLSYSPNRKLTGAEFVSLVKHMARQGWVLAFNASPQGSDRLHGVFVARGVVTKDMKSVASRLVGTLMGPEAKPKIERKAGRTLVAVPPQGQDAAAQGWVWWPEKNDLVFGIVQPSDADAILATLDGKNPNAADHPLVAGLSKPDGNFRPVLTAFVDPVAFPSDSRVKLSDFAKRLDSDLGIKRVEYRWGFDDDALMTVANLIAPKPRKPLLSLLESPGFDTKSLVPMPAGIDSFVVLSVAPAKAMEAVTQLGLEGDFKSTLDEVVEKLKTESRIDIEKDLLAHVGPKMVLYVAPGRSATTTAEETTPEPAAGAGGFNPMAIIESMQARFPKPTLVAEVGDPVKVGKALDAVMIAINKELRAQALEKAAQDEAAKKAGAGQGAAPGQDRRQESAGGRRRGKSETASPEFRLMPGAATGRTYMLMVPSNSPLKIGPPGFRPTIRLEGKYVAISTSADAARLAIESVRRDGWKPSGDVERALGHVPSNLSLLALSDPRETAPALLASLPGTLQTQINTMLALYRSGTNGSQAGGARPGQPGFGAAVPGGQPGRLGRKDDEGGPGRRPGGFPGAGGGPPPGFPGAGGGPPPGFPGAGGGPPPGFPGGARPGGAPGSAEDAMIQFKIDPANLPKAEELKSLMFPGTLTVTTDDQGIRLISRESFPNLFDGAVGGQSAAAILAPIVMAAQSQASTAAAAPAPGGPPGAGQPPAGGPGPGPAAAPAPPGGSQPPPGLGPGGKLGRGRRDD